MQYETTTILKLLTNRYQSSRRIKRAKTRKVFCEKKKTKDEYKVQKEKRLS